MSFQISNTYILTLKKKKKTRLKDIYRNYLKVKSQRLYTPSRLHHRNHHITKFNNNHNSVKVQLINTIIQTNTASIPFFVFSILIPILQIKSIQTTLFFLFNNFSSSMEDPSSKNNALITTLKNSIQALGRGFDVTSDIRLLYCKGAPGSHLIQLDHQHTKDLVFSLSNSPVTISDVSVDVDFSNGQRITEATPVSTFHEVFFCFPFFIF